MQTKIRALWLAPIVSLLAASTVPAAEFRSFSRAEQARGSDLIVVGRVESLLSYSSEPHSVIQTDVRVAIEDVWKGEPESERITVRSLGGVADGVAMKVDGASRFELGERVLLFLRERDDAYAPWGMRYGKYRIVGSQGDAFALGVLPPSVPGGERFREVSIALDELYDEVRSILDSATGAIR